MYVQFTVWHIYISFSSFMPHVDLTVLSIFQKAVTFDHNFAIKHNFLAFFIKYFFADKYILNEIKV